jgi:hypothetical protein
MTYPGAARERGMKIQEVITRAMSGTISRLQAHGITRIGAAVGREKKRSATRVRFGPQPPIGGSAAGEAEKRARSHFRSSRVTPPISHRTAA